MMNMVAQIHEMVDGEEGMEELKEKYGAGTTDLEELANELADQVYALDQWLQRGGFLPKAWDVPREGHAGGWTG
jgi:hypothetical protein